MSSTVTTYSAPARLHRQPLFLNKAFGPYLPESRQRLDYSKATCPKAGVVCYVQGAWLGQSLVDDVAGASEKVYEHREQLRKARV